MKTRVISAIVLLAIFIPILLVGGLPYSLLMALLSVMGLYEIVKGRKSEKDIPLTLEVFAYVMVVLFTLNNYDISSFIYLIDYRLIAALFFAFILPLIFVNNKKKYDVNDAFFLMGSTLFLGFSFNLLILIRNYSIHHIIYVFLITIITDTFALVTGKNIGKHKMAPKISPNKTWEGFFGGSLMGVVIPAFYFSRVIDTGLSFGIVLAMTFMLSVLGQMGDLVFSFIKREFNKKDFSNLIPGHGGILDRLDSIIFVVLGFLLFLAVL